MGTWLPMTMLISAQITLRLIDIASLIWGERVRTESHRTHTEAAGNSGTVFCECRADGTVLIVIPPTTSREQVSVTESLLSVRGAASAATAN